jgi:glycosyltransferase involved in cell wall biosynthesis
LRILIIHNQYQLAGGEDGVVAAEAKLLRDNGEIVELVMENNDGIVTTIDKIESGLKCSYSPRQGRVMNERLREFRPDVVHIHNFFPTLTPSIHYACYNAAIPVVQTLHNYRLLCPAATFLRDGKVCEDCMKRRVAWPAILHGCYRKSRLGSAAVASMLLVNRTAGTWNRTVSRYIALTEFARLKFIEGGFPADKVSVKSNFLSPDPGAGAGDGGYALYVGRLSSEKGVVTLLNAWRIARPSRTLKIVGDGPLAADVKAYADRDKSIEVMGWRNKEVVTQLISRAEFLVFPSLWYETFGLVAIEAMAAGLPVIASDLGAMSELIANRKTGLLFPPGSAEGLASAIQWAFDHPIDLREMRTHARREFEEKFTEKQNYMQLMDIYLDVVDDVRNAWGKKDGMSAPGKDPNDKLCK